MRVAAQLERRRDVDRAVERAGDQPPRERRAADRCGRRARAARPASPSRASSRPRAAPCRAISVAVSAERNDERAEQAQHPVGVDARGADGEGDSTTTIRSASTPP